MQTYQKIFIELALKHSALRFGEFKLKSGRISPYFFNVGQLNTGLALKVLGECYANAIKQSQISFDVIFGPAYKGIPLACSTAMALDVPFSFNRKEEKDHGEGGIIIGTPLKGKVLIIDDVITAGTAIRESFDILTAYNAKPAGIIVALDRKEKGQGNLSAIQEIQSIFDVPILSIISFDDIITYAMNSQDFKAFYQPMIAYRERYGV